MTTEELFDDSTLAAWVDTYVDENNFPQTEQEIRTAVQHFEANHYSTQPDKLGSASLTEQAFRSWLDGQRRTAIEHGLAAAHLLKCSSAWKTWRPRRKLN